MVVAYVVISVCSCLLCAADGETLGIALVEALLSAQVNSFLLFCFSEVSDRCLHLDLPGQHIEW